MPPPYARPIWNNAGNEPPVRILSLCMRRHTGKAAFLHEVTDDIDCCGAHTWIGAA
jgi:hypothetical protein